MTQSAAPSERHKTVSVKVGHVKVGGGAPIVVQSMTNTDTADAEGTAQQVAALARAGSEIVRITVDRDEAAAAVPHIKDKLLAMGVNVPLVNSANSVLANGTPDNGFGTSGVALGGSASPSSDTVSLVSGTTYDVSVSGMASNGTVTASVTAGTAHDPAKTRVKRVGSRSRTDIPLVKRSRVVRWPAE